MFYNFSILFWKVLEELCYFLIHYPFLFHLLVLEMLLSDHSLGMFFTISSMQQSDLFGKLFQKMCGIAQPVPNFGCSQTSWFLPCPVEVKGRQGEEGSLWVSGALCSLYAWLLHYQRWGFPLGVPLDPWGTGPGFPGSGEKLEELRKNELHSLILSEQMETLKAVGERERAGRGLSSPGQKEINGAGGILEVTFQGGDF